MSSQTPSYHGYRFPPDIISHAVWLYHRFSLSFRDAEDLLAQRGITVTYVTIRQWCLTFGPAYARTLRRRRGRLGDTWYLDEVFATIQGQRRYLWRAVDQDGDLLVQSRRNRRAAMCDVNLTKPLPSILLGDWLRIGLLCQLRPQLDSATQGCPGSRSSERIGKPRPTGDLAYLHWLRFGYFTAGGFGSRRAG